MSSNPKSENDHLINQLLNLISTKDVDAINDMQKDLLSRFEKSNQMLVYCNELSNQHFTKLSKDFRSHMLKLNEMNKDLDLIFHRIRTLKQNLQRKLASKNSKEENKAISDSLQNFTSGDSKESQIQNQTE